MPYIKQMTRATDVACMRDKKQTQNIGRKISLNA